MLEMIDLGVSVIDVNFWLVVWNLCYVEMFDYLEGYVVIGWLIVDLICYNVVCVGSVFVDIDVYVVWWMVYLVCGMLYSFEW